MRLFVFLSTAMVFISTHLVVSASAGEEKYTYVIVHGAPG